MSKILYWVEHTCECQTNTGVQRVVRSLARGLRELGLPLLYVRWDAAAHQLVLASRDDLRHLAKWNGPDFSELELADYPEAAKRPLTADLIGDAEWLLIPEVTHLAAHAAEPTLDAILSARALSLKVGIIFYDAIPCKRSEFAGMADRHAAYMQHLAFADLILPISEFSGRDLVAYFDNYGHFRPHTRPNIVPLLLSGQNWEHSRVTVPGKETAGPLTVLCFGTIEKRKNQTTLIEAFEAFCHKHPEVDARLVLSGNLAPDVAPQVMDATRRNCRISYLRYVSDGDLRQLLHQCAFTVFPSVEEGFGLPIIESLWSGKPCLTANFGAMAEVAHGGGCLTVDTRSPAQMLEGLETLLLDADLRTRLANEAVARPLALWSDYAGAVLQALDNHLSAANRLGTIYYWVDHTSTYAANSGIQRVVRGLGGALQKLDVPVVPVRWDRASNALAPVPAADLEHLAKWNGPDSSRFAPFPPPVSPRGKDWLVIPELTTYLPAGSLDRIVSQAHVDGMQVAIVFHDAIPYKLRDIYPPEATAAHAEYMLALSKCDLILPTSEIVTEDLTSFLFANAPRLNNLPDRILRVPLAGDFPNLPRGSKKQPQGKKVHLLSVGTVEPRKNHLRMVRAFIQAQKHSRSDLELTIIGGAPFPALTQEIEGLIAGRDDITWIRGTDDETLVAQYRRADFTVYPSYEEGFGIPIVESLWQTRPCLCHNAGAMEELARDGGCLTVDVLDEQAFAHAIVRLADDKAFRLQLADQALARRFRSWGDYGSDVLAGLAAATSPTMIPALTATERPLQPPLLSVCISTYNRAAWLDISLRNVLRQTEAYKDVVEVVVVDNASTDGTEALMRRYEAEGHAHLKYFRNPENVGMLGNLRVTANHTHGQFIWILGDDDVLLPGAMERILTAILDNPNAGLVYLHYSYTRIEDPSEIGDFDSFLASAQPISPPAPDKVAKISEIATETENFFTAIYCLIYRRDHGLLAYSQYTGGRPFSSLLTCIPTSYHCVNRMFDEVGVWIGEPCVVVNLNVSWMKYAPLWILERIPELYDLAEARGAPGEKVDRWRFNNLPGMIHFLDKMYFDDTMGNLEFFSFERMIRRYRHILRIDTEAATKLFAIYRRAFDAGLTRESSPQSLKIRYGLA
ncbi:MAG: glycosyltransferase [Bacteroidota bacterium]